MVGGGLGRSPVDGRGCAASVWIGLPVAAAPLDRPRTAPAPPSDGPQPYPHSDHRLATVWPTTTTIEVRKNSRRAERSSARPLAEGDRSLLASGAHGWAPKAAAQRPGDSREGGGQAGFPSRVKSRERGEMPLALTAARGSRQFLALSRQLRDESRQKTPCFCLYIG